MTNTETDHAAAIAKALDTRAADLTVGTLAFQDARSDAALAAAVSTERARLAFRPDAFTPTEATPTPDRAIARMAERAPYAISPKSVTNYRNAYRFLVDAGIDRTDAVSFDYAKRLVSKGAKPALAWAATLAGSEGAAAALEAKATGRTVSAAEQAEARGAKAALAAEARKADPVGFALAALLKAADGDAAASVALGKALRAAAKLADRQADAAAGGAAVVDVLTGEPVAA